MNKRGGLTDIFLLIIISFIILLISGIFIYIGVTTQAKLHETLDGQLADVVNVSATIDDTFGGVTTAFSALYWISFFIIMGMVISIFIGSHLVTTKPVFFVPYIFMMIIAITISVGVSNAYETLITTPILAPTYAGFTAGNFFMLNLPMWVTIIGFIGGIIMFSRFGSREEVIFNG